MIKAKHFNGSFEYILTAPETTGNFHPKFTPMRFRLAGIRLSRPESPRFQTFGNLTYHPSLSIHCEDRCLNPQTPPPENAVLGGPNTYCTHKVWLEDVGRLGVTEQKKITPTWLQIKCFECLQLGVDRCYYPVIWDISVMFKFNGFFRFWW